MRRDLKTVQEEDAVGLAEAVMRWEGIQHVPVENEHGELVGLLSLPDLLTVWKEGKGGGDLTVGEVMNRAVRTVGPATRTLDAIRLMRDEHLSCLPVVRDENKLVGILTQEDFLVVASRLLE